MPVGKSHSSVELSFLSSEKVVTAAQAVAPSGDSVGDAIRLIAQSASTESGGLAEPRPAGRRAAARRRDGMVESL
jgi:hypothetical protein